MEDVMKHAPTADTPSTYWQRALAGLPSAIHENDPQPGYYRARNYRGGPWSPIAIWRDSAGNLKALRDGASVDPFDIWTWCCTNAIPYETYVAVAERGLDWPDAIPELNGSGSGNDGPGSGHNSEAVDESTRLRSQIEALTAAADAWLLATGSIGRREEADKAANFAERFAALEKEAEEARTREKRPVLEQGKAIDAAWKPTVEAAATGKRRMKKTLEPWLLAEQQRLAEDASTPGSLASVSPPPRAGTSGRRVGLRTVRRFHVQDRDALIKAYRRDRRFWSHRLVDDALRDIAEADLRSGRCVPGAILVDEHTAA